MYINIPVMSILSFSLSDLQEQSYKVLSGLVFQTFRSYFNGLFVVWSGMVRPNSFVLRMSMVNVRGYRYVVAKGFRFDRKSSFVWKA